MNFINNHKVYGAKVTKAKKIRPIYWSRSRGPRKRKVLTNLRTSKQSMGSFGLRPESHSAGIGGEEVLVQEGWLLVAWLSSVSISF